MKTYTVTGGGGLKLHVQETGDPKGKPILARLAKHANLSLYPHVGHAPFWEAPERFNRELREFREAV